MTQEEKAKKYDEVVCKLRRFMEQGIDPLITRADVQDFFPELCESEDEKIRKSLIILLQHFCKGYRVPGLEFPVSYKDMLAWLEKQDESYTKRDVDDVYVEGMAFAKDELERQGEQKPVDKVGPKFKVGDWCIDNEDGTIFQIVKVLDNTYTYKTNEGKEYSCSHYSLENDAHLWTIQDARLGDVLANCNIICIYKKRESEHLIKVYLNYSLAEGVEITDDTIGDFNLYPATKEQRDTLFTKMKEAGYEWDSEKKELKKVEKKSQRMISAEAKEAMYDKPTDEDMREALRTEYEKGRADAFAQMQQGWSDKEKQMYADIIEATKKSGVFKEAYKRELVDFLNFLKERHTWKPSEKQMNAFEQVYDWYNNNFAPSETLTSLYNDLKKLREE